MKQIAFIIMIAMAEARRPLQELTGKPDSVQPLKPVQDSLYAPQKALSGMLLSNSALAFHLGMTRSALPHQQRRCAGTYCQAPAIAVGNFEDLVGDGGVLKQVTRQGSGAVAPRGATVEVHYDGRLVDTGAVFDSSRERGKTFKFTLGQGKVIGGWEVAVSTMQIGEMATITCSPQYAYGPKGIPPTIPPSATLQFDVELISYKAPQVQEWTLNDDDDIAKTPEAIRLAYVQKMANKPARKEGWEGFREWVDNIYLFGLDDGEDVSWWIRPIFLVPVLVVACFASFQLVVALGGFHRGGDLPGMENDISEFIGGYPDSPFKVITDASSSAIDRTNQNR